jgi:hypothetical protein
MSADPKPGDVLLSSRLRPTGIDRVIRGLRNQLPVLG